MSTLSKLYFRVGRDSSTLVRAPWRSTVIDIARRNINSGFGLAVRLAGAKNLSEAMELQAAYWRNQLSELATQAGEMRTVSTKVTADVAAPVKAQVTRGMKVLHKAT